MEISQDELKKALIALLDANMDGSAEGGAIFIDRDGRVVSGGGHADGREKGWLHTLFEVKCTDEDFHLIVNPKLNFRQEIDLMDEDVPDTVPEAVDFLWDDIMCGVSEYTECFQ